VYATLEGPVEWETGFLLPATYGQQIKSLDSDKKTDKLYIFTTASPFFNMTISKGTPRRVEYTFNNTVKGMITIVWFNFTTANSFISEEKV
jgi:hypothetical protein